MSHLQHVPDGKVPKQAEDAPCWPSLLGCHCRPTAMSAASTMTVCHHPMSKFVPASPILDQGMTTDLWRQHSHRRALVAIDVANAKQQHQQMHGLRQGGPYDVDGLGVVGEKVQDAPALLNVGLGVGAQAVHQVHKLDAVPDEEHLLHAQDPPQHHPVCWPLSDESRQPLFCVSATMCALLLLSA